MIKYNKFSDKFMITGCTRTGTTVLLGITALHPNVNKVVWEPFNLASFQNLFPKRTPPKKGLEILFHREKINGFKELVMTNRNGWPKKFEFDKMLIGEIFKSKTKLIVTKRNNILKQSISIELALNTKIWQCFDAKNMLTYPSNTDYINKVKEVHVDINKIKFQIKKYKEINDFLDKNIKGKDFFLIDYEKFFLGSIDYQKETLFSLFEYLGYSKTVNDEMLNLLKTGKLNNKNSYMFIKNIEEIEKEFSKKYGSLIQ